MDKETIDKLRKHILDGASPRLQKHMEKINDERLEAMVCHYATALGVPKEELIETLEDDVIWLKHCSNNVSSYIIKHQVKRLIDHTVKLIEDIRIL